MNKSHAHPDNQICTHCGLCCDGTIFADVKLQPRDNPKQLRSLGMPLLDPRRFSQPCPMFDGRLCLIYQHRPAYCLHFDCRLLQQLHAGRFDRAAASRTIRKTKAAAHKIRRLLSALGDNDFHLNLSNRFRNTTKRLQQQSLTPERAALYGQLTLAVLSLNVLLSEHFYDPTRPAGRHMPYQDELLALGVLTHNDRVSDVGQADTAFADEYDNGA